MDAAGVGMTIKFRPAGIRPNLTRFDGKYPSWLGLDFPRFFKLGLEPQTCPAYIKIIFDLF
jgi:hypothetical protein